MRNSEIKQEIFNFLQRFASTDIALSTLEDIKLLQQTRHEETIIFSDYLKNADWAIQRNVY